MDKTWRSSQPDGAKPYSQSRSWRPAGPVDSSEAAENLAEFLLRELSHDERFLAERINFTPSHIQIKANCNPAATGRLIGKGGKTITALRLLVRSIAHRRGKRVDVEVS